MIDFAAKKMFKLTRDPLLTSKILNWFARP